jgi:hypothetical protein
MSSCRISGWFVCHDAKYSGLVDFTSVTVREAPAADA